MDKYLITGAFLLLVFEISVLLGDMGLMPFRLIDFESQESMTQEMGYIESASSNVRRKSHSSILWEKSQSLDQVYVKDSILTLDNSTASLKLEGDIHIHLQENTLVYLEEVDQKKEDSHLRLSFYRGDLRSLANQKRLKLGTGDWNLDVSPGSDISLRSLGEDRIEVDLKKGSTELIGKDSSLQIQSGQRLRISESKVESQFSVSKNLRFQLALKQKLYAHRFPVDFELSWQGDAKQIIHRFPDLREESISIAKTDASFRLETGRHLFYLKNQSEESEILEVSVLPAPVISYFSPLPRERVKTSETLDFAWSLLPGIKSYRVELINKTDRISLGEDLVLPQSLVVSPSGDYYWQVIGIDEDGFEIPAYYKYPIYSIPKPLEAPKIFQRQPAKDKSSYFNLFLDWILPRAEAADTLIPENAELEFRWGKIPRAKLYHIEISSSSDFIHPELIEKSTSNSFRWKSFKAKKYYWRVAGEAEVKGLFSPVQELDLRKQDFSKAQEINASVSLLFPEAIIEPEIVQIPKPAPMIEQKPDNLQIDESPTEVKQTNLPLEIEVAAGYYYYDLDFQEDFQASFQDFQYTDLRLLFFFHSNWSVRIDNQYSSWKLEDETDSLFQEEIDWLQVAIHTQYHSGSFLYRFSIVYLGFPRRIDAEAIEISQEIGGSLGICKFFGSKWESEHCFDLGMSSSIQFLQTENSVYRRFSVGDSSFFDLGFRLEVDFWLPDEAGVINQNSLFVRWGF